jgi:hypothetical protein
MTYPDHVHRLNFRAAIQLLSPLAADVVIALLSLGLGPR